MTFRQRMIFVTYAWLLLLVIVGINLYSRRYEWREVGSEFVRLDHLNGMDHQVGPKDAE